MLPQLQPVAGLLTVVTAEDSEIWEDAQTGPSDGHEGDGFAGKSGAFDNDYATGDDGHGYGDNDGGEDGPPRDGKCYNCGDPDHFSKDCPEPKKPRGKCFNCDEEGHLSKECPHPKKPRTGCRNCRSEEHQTKDCPEPFTGTCKACGNQGHRANECPERPATICKNCLESGHHQMNCTKDRTFDLSNVTDLTVDEAWAQLESRCHDQSTVGQRDYEDLKREIFVLLKADPKVTWVDIEKFFMSKESLVHLAAMEKSVGLASVCVDLQGNKDKTYVVSFRKSIAPTKAIEKARLPSSADDNLERLADAGMADINYLRKCHECDEVGHSAKFCPNKVQQQASEIEEGAEATESANAADGDESADQATEAHVDPATTTPANSILSCGYCGGAHRGRECQGPRDWNSSGRPGREPRVIECRKCGEQGHMSKDCPQPDICRKCNEEGHMSRDCPKPDTCRKCGEEGHMSRDCPQPDTCRKCGEEGHMSRECTKPDTCCICNEEGHMARECPNKAKNDLCRRCNQPGHFAKDCTQSKSASCNKCGRAGHLAHECQDNAKNESEPSGTPGDRRANSSAHETAVNGFDDNDVADNGNGGVEVSGEVW